MILPHYYLKSLGGIFNKSAVNIFNGVRMYVTETSLQKITVRSFAKSRKRKNKLILGTLLVVPISSFGLGTWQVFRKFEKDKINENFLELLNKPPIDLPKDLSVLSNLEYHKVRVRGKFDHSKEFYLGPRPKNEDEGGYFSLLSRPRGGYLVITPFKLSDRNLTILVNRGWVPEKKKLPTNRPEGQTTEEVELVGLVRLHENKKPFVMKNEPEKNCWIYRDLYNLSQAAGAAPVLLDADKSSTIPGGPVGGQTLMDLKNNHLSYILTWYGISISSGYLWYILRFTRAPIVVLRTIR